MKELFGYSFLAFWAGVLLNFVPCVLPVIPFKVQAVLRELKGDISSRILAAAALLAGSISFFLLIGGATAYLGLMWGVLFQSKLFLAALTTFFFFAGIATFADWSVRLPQLVYRVPIHRHTGAFFTGAFAGILSTPCSGPFLGSVLAFALTQGPVFILMIFVWIGCGLAIPYVLVLLWPGLLTRMPSTGALTMQIKQLLGFVLLAGAIFFGRVFIPDAWHFLLWSIFYAAVIIWALYIFKRSEEWSGRIFSAGTMALVLFLGVLTLPGNQLTWQEFTSESLPNSLASHRPVLLEFTAAWCLNCKVLEKTTYADKTVIQAAKKIKLIPLRVDMTDVNAYHKALLEEYGGTALPFAVLIAGNGKVNHRFLGMFSAKTLETAFYNLQK